MSSNQIIPAETVALIWSKSRPKQALLEHLTWYFRPKSSLDPERVDYNALNILADFQLYNMEFAKNEICLNDHQTASILDLFWQILEFDPDETPSKAEIVQFHQDGSGHDAVMAQLLRHKINLLKKLIESCLDSTEAASINVEQARRLIDYAQRTYFKHLRLYEFVLKNSKTSEKKYVKIPLVVPQIGQSLQNAVVVLDNQTQIQYEDEDSGRRGGVKLTENEKHGANGQQSALENNGDESPENDDRAESDQEMDEMLKTAAIPQELKTVLHKSLHSWDDKIAQMLAKEVAK